MENRFLPPESLRFHVVWAAEHQFSSGENHFSPQLSVGWLWFIKSGQIEVSLELEGENSRRTLQAGDWLWYPPCARRWVHVGIQGANWLTVGLSARCGERDFFAPAMPFEFSPRNSARGEALLQLLCETRSVDLLERDGLARTLCGWLWNEVPDARGDELPLWLRGCLETLETRPQSSVAQLAKEAHFSPAQFRRLWEQHLGVSPREFLTTSRLERARINLETSNDSVAQISENCGFTNASQFSRAFKEHYGRAPLESRKEAREKGL